MITVVGIKVQFGLDDIRTVCLFTCFAVGSSCARNAVALVISNMADTRSVVLTRRAGAVIDF